MIDFLIDTASHFPACFMACVFSHWVLHKWNERKGKKTNCDEIN